MNAMASPAPSRLNRPGRRSHGVGARRGRGVTLIELAIVLAVAAILATLAIPALQDTMRKNRLDSVTNDFVAALSRARSEAVRLGQPVCLQSQSATAGEWTPGWNLNSASPCPNATAAAVLLVGSALPAPLTQWGSASTLGFDATGRLFGGPAVSFIFCADGTDPTKAAGVNVALSGRVRVADIDPVTGRPLDDQQKPMIDCQNP